MALHLMSLCPEENIFEICIRLGNTHPLGVLCYSATKSIILFQLTNEMQYATCGAIKATVLHEKAIAIRASAPSKTHMKAYMTTVDGEPSITQPLPLDGGEGTSFTHW